MNHYYPELYYVVNTSLYILMHLRIIRSFHRTQIYQQRYPSLCNQPKNPYHSHKNPSHLRIFIDPFTKSCFVSSIFWWFIFVVQPRTKVRRKQPLETGKPQLSWSKPVPKQLRLHHLWELVPSTPLMHHLDKLWKLRKRYRQISVDHKKRIMGIDTRLVENINCFKRVFQGRKPYCNHIIKNSQFF